MKLQVCSCDRCSIMLKDKEDQEAQKDQEQKQNQEAEQNGCRRIPGACPLGAKKALEPEVAGLNGAWACLFVTVSATT